MYLDDYIMLVYSEHTDCKIINASIKLFIFILGKPKKCLKKRFSTILKVQSSGKAADYIPECDKKGKFVKKQCNQDKCKYI